MNLFAHAAVAAASSGNTDTVGGWFVGGFFGFFALMSLLSVAFFIFWIIMIIDVARREFPNENDKTLWLVVVILLGVLGAIVYFFTAHNSGHIPKGSGPEGHVAPQSPAPSPEPPSEEVSVPGPAPASASPSLDGPMPVAKTKKSVPKAKSQAKPVKKSAKKTKK